MMQHPSSQGDIPFYPELVEYSLPVPCDGLETRSEHSCNILHRMPLDEHFQDFSFALGEVVQFFLGSDTVGGQFESLLREFETASDRR